MSILLTVNRFDKLFWCSIIDFDFCLSQKFYEHLLRVRVEQSEAYSEPCQTSKMEHFVKIVNCLFDPQLCYMRH